MNDTVELNHNERAGIGQAINMAHLEIIYNKTYNVEDDDFFKLVDRYYTRNMKIFELFVRRKAEMYKQKKELQDKIDEAKKNIPNSELITKIKL